jgi:tRNA threonylcarbamoyladenosine biosynthesis protein TsaB
LNLLAFDTSTEALSVAVRRGAGPACVHDGPGGAQASTTLIPVIQDLLARAGLGLRELDAIVFGRGPGSFTGLRTACSVAQGLAFGSGTPVLPVDTLLAAAEQARFEAGFEKVVAVLDARMGEVYWGAYLHEQGRWRREGEIGLGSPESVAVPTGWAMTGNAFAAYAGRLPADAPRAQVLPTASALLRLSAPLLSAGLALPASGALPLYIRDKVAQTTAERAAIRAQPSPQP